MDVRISAKGSNPVEDLEELARWLTQEPELRGLVKPGLNAPRPGELGTLTDVLIVAAGSGGALSLLAASLKAFLRQPRRSDIRIVLSTENGRRLEVDAKRVDDVEALLRRTLELPEE